MVKIFHLIIKKYQDIQGIFEELVFLYLRKIWLLIIFLFFALLFLFILLPQSSAHDLISFVVPFLGVLLGAFISWSKIYKEVFESIRDKAYNIIEFLLSETEIFLDIKEALLLNYENDIEDQKEEKRGYYVDTREDRIARRLSPNRDINSFFNNEYFEKSIQLKNLCEDYFYASHSDVVELISLIKQYHFMVANISSTGNDSLNLDLLMIVENMLSHLQKIKNNIKNTLYKEMGPSPE